MQYILYFFFFQAEDGIRDKLVTGVQTCALPISSRAPAGPSSPPSHPSSASLGAAEPIARATDGLDPRARLAQLVPQPLDVHVDGARLNVGLSAPHRLEQLRTALDPSFPFEQCVQQLELGRGELDFDAAHRHSVRSLVEHERTR